MDTILDALRAGIGIQAVYYCLAAIGLNVQFGYAGLLNFGQAGFLAVAAYTFGVSIASFNAPFFVAVALAMLACLLLALILGVPTLRLRADYLAIATIATSEVLRLFFGASLKQYFNARDGVSQFAQGFRSVNPYDSGHLGFSRSDLWVMTVGWILIALSCVLIWLLMRSPWGRVQKAIREDEEAVRSLGKNVFAYRMQALILGGMIGGLGGIMLALGQNSIQPDNFSLDLTFITFTMLLLGGAARVLGPVVGAVLFWAFLSLIGGILSDLTRGADPVLPTWLLEADQIGTVRFMLVGIALMLLMIFRPQGIFGDRKEIAIDAR